MHMYEHTDKQIHMHTGHIHWDTCSYINTCIHKHTNQKTETPKTDRQTDRQAHVCMCIHVQVHFACMWNINL